MQSYVILTRFGAGAFRDPREIKDLATKVRDKVQQECKGLEWKASYATFGRFDVVDIVESGDPAMVQRAALIIGSIANATTETLPATPWPKFLSSL